MEMPKHKTVEIHAIDFVFEKIETVEVNHNIYMNLLLELTAFSRF